MVTVRVEKGIKVDISLPLFDRLLHNGVIVWNRGWVFI